MFRKLADHFRHPCPDCGRQCWGHVDARDRLWIECPEHGTFVRVPAESQSDTAASCDPAGTPDRTFVADRDG